MEEENPTPESGASNGRSRTPLIIGGIVILALVLVGLSLPPISIWDRFGSDSADSGEEIPQLAATAEAPETTDAGSESAATNAQSIPGEVTLAVTDGSANVASVSAADYAATSNLPSNVAAVGNVYTVDGSGNGRAALAIPAGEDTRYLDMYGYDGSAWNFVPSSVNATTGEMISEEGPLPQAFVIAKANGASGQTVASELLPTQELPAEVTAVLTELSLGTLTLALDADNNVSLQGMVVASDAATDGQFVRVTNTGAVVDSNS